MKQRGGCSRPDAGIGVSLLIVQHRAACSGHLSFQGICFRVRPPCSRIIHSLHTHTRIHTRPDDGKELRIYVEHLARRRQVCSVTTRSVQSA